MKASEVLDSDKEYFSILTARQKYALTIFALLDAVSILRAYPEISSIFEYGPELHGLWLIRLIIIASFAFFGCLFYAAQKRGPCSLLHSISTPPAFYDALLRFYN
tara:strand:+ start:12393 stop:12707 length:315 start_codon:yes stop_codon:yes gene_type:complete